MSYIRKDGTTAPPSPRTLETLRRRAIGRRLAQHLKPIRSAQEVADMLGCSPQTIRVIEEEALYKCAVQIRKITLEAGVQLEDVALPGAAVLEAE